MRPTRLPTLFLAAGLVAAACSNSDAPTSIEIDIDEIRIVSGACAMPEGATCSVVAEARSNGIVVSNPTLRWISSNSTVASVEGNGSSAVVRGHALGSATIRVENTNGDAFDEVRATVLPCSKC